MIISRRPLSRIRPGMAQRKDLFASRHCKHSPPCTNQQPAESLASTRNAFARRAFRSTSCRVSVHGVVGAKNKNARDSSCACCAQLESTLLQAHQNVRARRHTNAPEMISDQKCSPVEISHRNTHTAPRAAQANEDSERTFALGLLLKAPRCQDKLGADWLCFLFCFFSLLCCRVRCLCDFHTCVLSAKSLQAL